MYALLANLILFVHFAIVVFVVGGFILIVIGILQRWHWVESFWLRALHLLAIVVVTVQTLLGNYCPLTIWEVQLRLAAGEPAYSTSFIQYWVERLIYYDIPLWIFAIIYSVFTALVVLTWVIRPPKRRNHGKC